MVTYLTGFVSKTVRTIEMSKNKLKLLMVAASGVLVGSYAVLRRYIVKQEAPRPPDADDPK